MKKQKARGSLPPEEPPPLPPRDSGGIQCTDPRRFNFGILCKNCGQMYASLQEARAHFRACPSGSIVDVLCGRCEMRTSSWSAMCAHLNKAGMQKQAACKPEYRLNHPSRPEFRRTSQPLQPLALPRATVTTGQASVRRDLLAWRSPPQLTLSPSREEAGERRHAELRSILLHWNRKHPGRVGMRGVGQGLPSIPLDPMPSSGYRLSSAAAESARDLAPTSPDPEEAYEPPLEAEDQWTSEGLVSRQSVAAGDSAALVSADGDW